MWNTVMAAARATAAAARAIGHTVVPPPAQVDVGFTHLFSEASLTRTDFSVVLLPRDIPDTGDGAAALASRPATDYMILQCVWYVDEREPHRGRMQHPHSLWRREGSTALEQPLRDEHWHLQRFPNCADAMSAFRAAVAELEASGLWTVTLRGRAIPAEYQRVTAPPMPLALSAKPVTPPDAAAPQNALPQRLPMLYGGVASALVNAIRAKPAWYKKAADPAIAAAWRREFLEQAPADFGLSVEAAMRVYDTTLAVLTQSRAMEAEDGVMDDWDSPIPADVQRRPLEMTARLDDLTFKCTCKCNMCGDGSFPREDDAMENPHPDYDGEKTFAAYLSWTQQRCDCYPQSQQGLRAARDAFLHRATVQCRDALPDDVVEALMGEVALLEATATPDWHPGSNGLLQDLVHPSLYCHVPGVTAHAAAADDDSNAKRHRPEAATAAVEVEDQGAPSGDQHRAPLLQVLRDKIAGAAPADTALLTWLPTDFAIRAAPDGTRYAEPRGRVGMTAPDSTQRAITAAVTALLPHFEALLRSPAVKHKANTPSAAHFAAGRTIQVIPKLVSSRLTREHPTFPAGAWHLEGVAAEQILATTVVYLPSENVTPSSLSFRVAVENDDLCGYPQCGEDWVKTHWGFDMVDETEDDSWDRNFRATCELGTIATEPGMCLVFPNNLQHKVGAHSLLDASGPDGRRRILVLWLVAPWSRVPSTCDVPDATNGGAIGYGEACAYRELLMLQRKYAVAHQTAVYERKVSLCEH